ncbi:MAG: threonine--tRNA ligase [candidate division Zixibacteria bacterium]|nr:threonine--tRNA ligase [candidate division Zixibacteria bacterium]
MKKNPKWDDFVEWSARAGCKEKPDSYLIARLNGELKDLSAVIGSEPNYSVKLLTFEDPEGRTAYWHSTSHIMAQAVQELFSGTRLGIGPAIEEGFYYDFDKKEPFTPEDLEKIEKGMAEIIKEDLPFEREELSKYEASNLFREKGEKYKLELIAEFDSEKVSIYKQGDFVDLCRGPHLFSAGKVKAFKLLQVAGAYWRGNEKNPMLQRIYGISFPSQKELDDFLKRLEEAKRRDHRKLGRELDLFDIYDEAGGGLVFWHPKGALIRRLIEDFWVKEHYKAGYELLNTPHIAKLDLWKKSGHTDFYTEYMYSPMKIEEEEYEIKPMNCPFHILVYKSKLRSYKELPIKWAELGTVYRYERSGVLHGLLRVRGFTQDDAHIFCQLEQLEEEIIKLLDFTLFFLRSFGFQEYEVYLATRPEKYIGDPATWEKATEALKQALIKHNLPFKVDEGGGAFYGPKIDLKVKDLLGRAWQCTTLQFDFNLPERFDLHFVGKDGAFQRPIMIHRALLGSLERFFGLLIEHYAGAFPVWLSPVQISLLPITGEQHAYAREVKKILEQKGFRVRSDERNEKINFKIRESEVEKIPYMLILGKKEEGKKTVSVRRHGSGDLGEFSLEDIIAKIEQEIVSKQ